MLVLSSHRAAHGMTTPMAMPRAISSTSVTNPASELPTSASRTTTTGRARPSLTPLSTFKRWRSLPGTYSLPTMAEANTGSVGLKTAPTRKEAAHGSPATKCARSAVTSRVSGMPKSSARPGKCQAEVRSRTPARIPSVNSTANSASSASRLTKGVLGAQGHGIREAARDEANRQKKHRH